MILNVWVADFRCGEHNMHRRVKYERKFPQHTLTTFFVWARIYLLQPYCSRGRLAPRSSFSKYYLQSRCGWYCVHILHCVAMPCFLLFCLFLLFSCTMSLWWVCEIGFKKLQGISWKCTYWLLMFYGCWVGATFKLRSVRLFVLYRRCVKLTTTCRFLCIHHLLSHCTDLPLFR